MHKHKARSVVDRPFFGPVTSEVSGVYAQRREAHGGICEEATCACGATRLSNVNRRWVERGRWQEH